MVFLKGVYLGHYSFLCYVNNMYTSVCSECKLTLYADDSAILFAHKDPEVILHKLSKIMVSCSYWLIDNNLSLHLG